MQANHDKHKLLFTHGIMVNPYCTNPSNTNPSSNGKIKQVKGNGGHMERLDSSTITAKKHTITK